MTVDPATFIVRSGSYPQNAAYPDTCAQITQELLDKKEQIKSANQLVAYVSERLRQTKPNHRSNSDAYGKPYTKRIKKHKTDTIVPRISEFDDITDPGGDNRLQIHEEMARNPSRALDLHGKLTSITHPLNDSEMRADHHSIVTRDGEIKNMDGKVLQLNTVFEFERNTKMVHPTESQEEHNDRIRWKFIRESFANAIDTTNSTELRQTAALENYWWLSQSLPVEQGTDTLARITLEYLSHRVGFEVPFVKEKKSYARFAQMRELPDFIAGWKNGEYFDLSATSQEILDWQKQHLTSNQPKL